MFRKLSNKTKRNSKSPKPPLDNKKRVTRKLSGKAKAAGAFKNFTQAPATTIDQKDPNKGLAKRKKFMKRALGV